MSRNTNKVFWNKFYKEEKAVNKPSNFAFFILKFLNKYKSRIIDIGCGNGRDLLFFKRNNLDFLGIDLSKNATQYIKKKLKNKSDKKKILNSDFVKFDYKNKIKDNFSIYSRFTWHTINEKSEKVFLRKISKIKNLDFIFIETRSDKDDLYGVGKKIGKNEFVTDHYRRFINKKDLSNQFNKNFEILYLNESKGFSKFKKEDPCLIRMIAKKRR